ncbi:MAG TPA: hypothetical protein VEH76_01395 [Methylocystis sp.]|nr:hypothetical protein [Methylocystis sp.]
MMLRFTYRIAVTPDVKMTIPLNMPPSMPKTLEACEQEEGLQFIIGQDLRGHWIVTEGRKRAGGIFVNRETALKYATSEWGQRPEMIRWANEPLALWT